VRRFKREADEGEGRETGFKWAMVLSPRNRWWSVWGEFSSDHKSPTKHKTPAVNRTKHTASSHLEAAACKQTPTN